MIDAMVVSVSRGNKLSLIIYDGEIMYVHTNFRNNLHFRDDENGICISTRPLADGQWHPISFCRLLGFQDGRQIFNGTEHEHEFIYNKEDMKAVYLAYSGL